MPINEQIDRLSYESFLEFIEKNPPTKHLIERIKHIIMEISNLPNNHGNSFKINLGDNYEYHFEGNNYGTQVGHNYGSITNHSLSEIKVALYEEDLSKEDLETVLNRLNEIETMISQNKEPSVIKKALNGLAKLLLDLGATAASTLIQMKMKELF